MNSLKDILIFIGCLSELPCKIIMLNYFNYVFKNNVETIINLWNNNSANITDAGEKNIEEKLNWRVIHMLYLWKKNKTTSWKKNKTMIINEINNIL